MSIRIDLSGKRALVTGGARGIGQAVSMGLAKAGAEVGFTFASDARAARETSELIRSAETSVWYRQTDASDAAQVGALFEEVGERWPEGLDILVANAGVWPAEDRAVSDITVEQWRRTIAVNLDGVFLVTREALRRFRDGGRIVVVGSGAGVRGEPYHADYSASKGALNAFVKAVCVETAPRAITVNCVAPGWVDTEAVSSRTQGRQRQEIESTIPLGRIATREDIAGPVVFLCSDLARHITGEVLRVGGGAFL